MFKHPNNQEVNNQYLMACQNEICWQEYLTKLLKNLSNDKQFC